MQSLHKVGKAIAASQRKKTKFTEYAAISLIKKTEEQTNQLFDEIYSFICN